MFKRNNVLMQRDSGKGGFGKSPAPKKDFMGKVLAEPPALSAEVVKLLSFMRGEPVDYGKVYDAREVLLLGPPKEHGPKPG